MEMDALVSKYNKDRKEEDVEAEIKR